MRFKSRKKLLKEYEKLDDGEKRIGRGIEGIENTERRTSEPDRYTKPSGTTEGKELLQIPETNKVGKGNSSSRKNSTAVGRIKRRFQRR